VRTVPHAFEPPSRVRPVRVIGLTVLVVYAALLATAAVLDGRLPVPVEALAVNGVAAATALATVVASRRRLGARRSLRGYGLVLDRRAGADLITGASIGLVAVAVPFLIGLAGGWLEVADVLDRGVMGLWTGIGLIVLANLCVAFWEELLLRGVFLRTAADGLARRLGQDRAVTGGIIISATVFGLAHLAQPALPSFVLTWVLAGVVLGVAAVRSGGLALPIGAHAAFNVAYQALVVRTDLEGIEAVSAILRVDVDPTLPALGFGGVLESSAFGLLGVLTLLVTARRGR
jgi:uncharacterized protein